MPARQSVCLNHPDRLAAHRCHHCNKPVCGECVRVLVEGEFCSVRCLSQFRAFHARYRPEPRKSRLIARLVGAAVTVALVLGLLYAGAIFKIGICQKILSWFGLW